MQPPIADAEQLPLGLEPPAGVSPGPAAPPVPAASRLEKLWLGRVAEWSRLWGVTNLGAVLRVEVSHRMRTCLGSYLPDTKRIRISDVVLEGPPQILEEIVCHEAAHAAVELLHGDAVRAHGREWQALMRLAGYDPRARIPGEALGAAAQRAARRRWVWEHRCPVCKVQRLAGRPVRQWRCASCVAAGRAGRLDIRRRPRPHGDS